MTQERLLQTIGSDDAGFLRESFAHAWRYWRQSRGLMIPLAVGPIVLVGLAFLLSAAFNPYGDDFRATEAVYLCVAAGGLFALAFGATSFAAEHENKTVGFLRALPLRPSRLTMGLFVAGILGFAATTGLSFLLLASLDLAVGKGRLFSLPWLYEDQMGAIYWLGLSMAFLVWGVFFSLKVRRVIWAALLAAAVAYSLDLALMSLISPSYGLTWERAAEFSHYRLALAAVLLLVDAALIRQWLRPERESEWSAVLSWLHSTMDRLVRHVPRLATGFRRLLLSGAQPELHQAAGQQLLWLHARQAGLLIPVMRMIAALLGLTIVVGLFVAIFAQLTVEARQKSGEILLFPGICLILAMQVVTGAFVFGPDRWWKTRSFLAARHIPPGQIWLARQRWGASWSAVWIALLVGWAVLLTTLNTTGAGNEHGISFWCTWISASIVLYATGQLAGMAANSFFLSIILAGGLWLCGWVMPSLLFPVGPDESVPGLNYLLTFVVFLGGMLWQSRRMARLWLEDRRAASLKDTLRSPVLWSLILVGFVLPWFRFLLVPQADATPLREARLQAKSQAWFPSTPEAYRGYAAAVEMHRLMPASNLLSARTGTQEELSNEQWREKWEAFRRLETADAFFRLVAELPKQQYADARVEYRLCGLAENESGASASDVDGVLLEFLTAPVLDNLARAAVEAGELGKARELLLAALALLLRAERTYPQVFHKMSDPNWKKLSWEQWANIVWRWSHADGQTPDALHEMQHAIQQAVAHERIPLDVRVWLIYKYWQEAFLRDAPYGMGYEGPRVAWWPGAMFLVPSSVNWVPGEWQLYQVRMQRIAAEYLPLAEEYEERGVFPRKFQEQLKGTRPGAWSPMPIGWSAAQSIRSALDGVFLARMASDRYFKVTQLRLAIWLHKLELGNYPERLEQLVPRYLEKIPCVPGSGRPFLLRYSRTSSGEAVLSAAPVLDADGEQWPLQ